MRPTKKRFLVWNWSGDQEDFQTIIVYLDFVGSVTVSIPGHSYTITHSSRDEEVVCMRLYKKTPTVSITAKSAGTMVGASVEVYSM